MILYQFKGFAQFNEHLFSESPVSREDAKEAKAPTQAQASRLCRVHHATYFYKPPKKCQRTN